MVVAGIIGPYGINRVAAVGDRGRPHDRNAPQSERGTHGAGAQVLLAVLAGLLFIVAYNMGVASDSIAVQDDEGGHRGLDRHVR